MSERSHHQTHFVLICLICLQLSKDGMQWWEYSVCTTESYALNYTRIRMVFLWWKWDGQAKSFDSWYMYVSVFVALMFFLKISPFCSLKKNKWCFDHMRFHSILFSWDAFTQFIPKAALTFKFKIDSSR